MGERACDRVRGLLPRYREGDLNEKELREVRAHLAVCEGCRKELKALEKLFDVVASVDLEPPNEHFWLRFPAKVRQRIEEKERRSRRAKGLVPVLGGAVLALLALLFPWREGDFETGDVNFEMVYESGYGYYLDQLADEELTDLMSVMAEKLELGKDMLQDAELIASDTQFELSTDDEAMENLGTVIEEYLARRVGAETIIVNGLSDDEVNILLRKLEELSSS